MISSREVNRRAHARASSSSRSCRRNVPSIRIVNDHGCSPDGFLSSLLSLPHVHGNRIPERHDVTRRKEAAKRERLISSSSAARTLAQREADSINRISGRSLIIHLCTPVRRMANPRAKAKPGIFSLSRARRERISFPRRDGFPSPLILETPS